MNVAKSLDVNDYLDLYLFAENIGDTLWQEEIVKKLKNFPEDRYVNQQKSEAESLEAKYKQINEEILKSYHYLRNYATNNNLKEKIMDLKQQRIAIGRQLNIVKKNSFEN